MKAYLPYVIQKAHACEADELQKALDDVKRDLQAIDKLGASGARKVSKDSRFASMLNSHGASLQ